MTSSSTSNGSEYPFGFILCFANMMDTLWGESSEWRNSVPFGWSDPGRALSWKSPGRVTDSFPQLLTFGDFVSSQQEQQEQPQSWIQNVYKYAFETPSTELGNVLSPTSLVVLVFLVFTLRQVKSKLCLPTFSKWGRRAGRHTHGREWELQNEERIVKFGEYVFRLLFHSFVSVAGVVYFWNADWWQRGNTTSLWNQFPHDPILPGMAWYYLGQCAYNVDALLSLLELSWEVTWGSSEPPQHHNHNKKKTNINNNNSHNKTILRLPFVQLRWSSTCRGDFTEMFVHHIVTNLLVMGSSFFRLTRVGSMVFLVHDISDVPVDLSKLANFLKWKMTTVVCFITMVLIWLVTRLGIFPFVIYKSVLVESYLITLSVDPLHYYTFRWFFVTLIAMIILLHVAWFGMFIQMGYILVTKNETHDLSEHKQGEPDAFGSSTTTTQTSTNETTTTNGSNGNSNSSSSSTNGKKHN